MKETYYLIIYAIINLFVFILYGVDKFKAKHDRWRISEKTLLIAAVFGVIGALAGMTVFHHKTRKPKFYVTVPLILIIEIFLLLKLTGNI